MLMRRDVRTKRYIKYIKHVSTVLFTLISYCNLDNFPPCSCLIYSSLLSVNINYYNYCTILVIKIK